jgi:hypothetical protein
MTVVNFLELTSRIGEPEEYADFPEFQSDVWPLLRQKANEIEGVFVFAQPRSRSWSWPGRYEAVSERIVRLSPTTELTQEEFKELEHLSFYGGHLNVLYQLPSGSPLLHELCAMYPTVSLSSDDLDQLALDPEPLAELRAFTDALPQESLHFAFAHDGDPLFVFGYLETLRSLLRSYYASR